MKFVRTSELDMDILEQFFEDKWQQLEDKETLQQNGYLIEYDNQYKAYFALAPVVGNRYWLKSLYIKQGVPASFPLAIIESAIALSREKQASGLYVHSHQQTLSSLLTLLNFEVQPKPSFANELDLDKGTWWQVDPTRSTQLN